MLTQFFTTQVHIVKANPTGGIKITITYLLGERSWASSSNKSLTSKISNIDCGIQICENHMF